MTKVLAIFARKEVIIIILVLAVLAMVYFGGKQAGKLKFGKPERIDLPDNGAGIPGGWTPTPVVYQLKGAMEGFGTDTEAIWDSLEPLNEDQLAAVYNEFNNQMGESLFDWFEDDLSGDDLRRATGYFAGIV